MRLAVSNLQFSFGAQRVFADVSFSVADGEILSIIGPNGAGKSTLLRCLNGLLRPDHGRIAVDGRDILSLGRKTLGRMIGYVPQSGADTFGFSVFDMVMIGRAAHVDTFSTPRESDRKAVERALRLVGLQAVRDKNFNQLSGGQAQLVAIARALAAEPDIILLDEPTAHLDIYNQAQVLRVLRDLAASKGLAVIMTTHSPDHAFLFSSKVLLMQPGREGLFGSPVELMTPETVGRVYGIGVSIVGYDPKNPASRTVVPDWFSVAGPS